MIRINLASATAVRSGGGAGPIDSADQMDPEVRKQAVMKIIILFAAPLALYAYQQMTIPELNSNEAKNQAQLAELTAYNAKAGKSVEEIKKFKEDQAKIQERIASLDKLTKNRFRDIKILDLIQQVIPEKVWLTRMDSKEGKISMQGLALSDFEVSTFMEFLSKSVYFIDVNLVNSNEIIVDGVNLKKFEIACTTEKKTAVGR